MSPLRKRSKKTTRHNLPTSDINTWRESSEPSEPFDNEPTCDTFEPVVHAPNTNKPYVPSWLWFAALIPLLIVAAGVRLGHDDNSSDPLVPKRLTVVNDFVAMARERVDIAKTALKSAKLIPGSNYTTLCSLQLFHDYLIDIAYYALLFDTGGTTPWSGLSRTMTLELNYSLPENCATSHLNKSILDIKSDLGIKTSAIRHDLGWLLNDMRYKLRVVFPWELWALEDYLNPKYRFSYKDISEEAIQYANETAWEVVVYFEDLVGDHASTFNKHCAELGSILERLKKNISEYKAWMERFRNCTLHGAHFVQHHMVDLKNPSLAKDWERFRGRWFASDAQRPYDEAKALIDIGMMPLISRMETTLETYSKHHFEWCESPNSFRVRITKLYFDVKEFAEGPSKRAPWYSWVNKKPQGHPWVDRKLGVHWWMPSANEVYEILESLQEEVGLANRLLNREARDKPTRGFRCGEGQQVELRRLWWREKVPFTERLKQAWHPLGAYLREFWKHMTDDRSATGARTLYEVLGASPTATEGEIKQAFKKMAVKHHPDKNGGNKEANEKFREIVDAYDVLKDPVARDNYDRNGDAANNSGGGYSAYPTEQDDQREEWEFWFGKS